VKLFTRSKRFQCVTILRNRKLPCLTTYGS
jgi:hypothetical protein